MKSISHIYHAIFVSAVTLCTLLNGCASPEELAERQRLYLQAEADAKAAQEAEWSRFIEVWTARCAAYGYQRNTAGMGSCVQNEAQAYQVRVANAQMQAMQAEAAQRRANLCMAAALGRPTATGSMSESIGYATGCN